MIRQPFLPQSAISPLKLKATLSAAPSCMLMNPLQASALRAAMMFRTNNEGNESDSDGLEELSFEESSNKPLMLMKERKVRLDYVSDYEFDEDNDSLLIDEDDDDLCSVDSDVTLPVSNKAYANKLHGSTSSSATNSTTTATEMSSDCSISSVASFDSEVAVSKHHQPAPIYHHHHHNHNNRSSSPPSSSTRKTPRRSAPSTRKNNIGRSFSSGTTTAKKPFVRPDLMPTPLNKQSLLFVPPPSTCPPPRRRKAVTIERKLVRTSSCRSADSIKTI